MSPGIDLYGGFFFLQDFRQVLLVVNQGEGLLKLMRAFFVCRFEERFFSGGEHACQ